MCQSLSTDIISALRPCMSPTNTFVTRQRIIHSLQFPCEKCMDPSFLLKKKICNRLLLSRHAIPMVHDATLKALQSLRFSQRRRFIVFRKWRACIPPKLWFDRILVNDDAFLTWPPLLGHQSQQCMRSCCSFIKGEAGVFPPL